MNEKKKGTNMFILVCIIAFIVSFGIGVATKFLIAPSWSKDYSVEWNNEIGILKTDIAYGKGEANKFDLYLPKDNTKEYYGLVVYLHAGGFTAGDKLGDVGMLSWLCSKGYVAVGINYTLRNDINKKSVLSQSYEIKEAIPKVIEAAEKYGYHIDKMGISGGSAGHALAMIYAYRDAETSPVPVKLLFGAVGPSSFYTNDWDIYGFDKDTNESREGAAGLFSIMGDVELTKEMMKDGSYIEKLKPISAVMWIDENTVPSVVAYGKYDKVQPYKGSQRLLQAFIDNDVDYKYFECSHSGHGLQNDNKVYKKYMETVDEYLEKYIPINN
ncbi:alpha/beta hydrolase [[Clostridium] innocuum]|nr:alpha/beta hydrolase [[Clostridium] innocuum]